MSITFVRVEKVGWSKYESNQWDTSPIPATASRDEKHSKMHAPARVCVRERPTIRIRRVAENLMSVGQSVF